MHKSENVSPIRENSNMDSPHLKSVKKYFQKKRFSENMKIWNRAQMFIISIGLEVCFGRGILLQDRGI